MGQRPILKVKEPPRLTFLSSLSSLSASVPPSLDFSLRVTSLPPLVVAASPPDRAEAVVA